MKSFSLFLFSCIFSLQLVAQKAPFEQLDLQRDGNYYQRNHPTPFSGEAFENYKNGKKKSRAEFKNGKLNGKVTTWHSTGEKSTLVSYKNGITVGTEIHWYDTGVKKLEISYDDEGLASGICKEYYSNGKLKSEGRYEKDLETGLHKWYFQNEDMDQTIEYVKGLPHGKVKHYYKGGKIKMNADYKEGVPSGKVIHYYQKGGKKKESNFVAGKEQGKDFLWSDKGLLLEERDYTDGKETAYMNYRSAAIKTKKGFLQVFNEKESFFTVHVNHTGWVRSKPSKYITYVVNDFVLQIFNTSLSSFNKEIGLDDETLLQKHMESEKAFIEKGTGSTIIIQKEFKKIKSNSYLHWSFESPELKDVRNSSNKTVEKEHYFTFVCNQQILMLYVPQTKGNNESQILRTMEEIASTVEVKSNRIDMNQLRIQVRENAGLPPLPANETVTGYKKNGEK